MEIARKFLSIIRNIVLYMLGSYHVFYNKKYTLIPNINFGFWFFGHNSCRQTSTSRGKSNGGRGSAKVVVTAEAP